MINQNLNFNIMNSHFNTTKESGNQLSLLNEIAINQEDKILELMTVYKRLSPSDVWKYHQNYPITSIRRAMTNLSTKGKLVKTDEKKIGIYGRNEFIWQLV
jgi:hypothetical protein